MKKMCLLILLFSNVLILQAQETTGTIRGVLYDETTGEPVVYAKVIVFDLDSVIIAGAFSDLDGFFNIPKLSPGMYNIQVHDLEHELEIVSDEELKPKGTVTLNIFLKEKKQTIGPVFINGIYCHGPKVSDSTMILKTIPLKHD